MRKAYFWLAFLAVAVFTVIPTTARSAEPKPITMGFIYVSPVGDEGWSYAHDLGRKAADNLPAVDTAMMENVPEGPDAERAILNMARRGYNMIFATSFGYMDPMLKVAAQFPNVNFFHCSGYKTAPNMTAYFGRMYQARYLTGMVAGAMTKKNDIGYVAAFPIPEVVRGINAFTLGVRAVNPEARVRVVWTRTWYSPSDEKKAALSLLDAGVDVIAQHQDSAGPQEAAQERGVYSIGYNTDMSKMAPQAHLTAAIWNWADEYKKMAQAVQSGVWKHGNYWLGMETGVVSIAPFGPMVPENVRTRVNAAKADIVHGKLVVFQGPVNDQAGKERIPANVTPPDSDLLAMDWFVEGVIGKPE